MYPTITVGTDVRAGEIFAIPKLRGMGVSLYNATGGTYSKGQPKYWEVVGATPNICEQAVVPETSGTIRRMVVFPMEDILTLKIGKFQFAGLTECLCADTASLSAGQFMQNLTNNAYLSDGTSLDVYSLGVLMDAIVSGENSGSPILKTVYLRGERIITAGS